MLVRKKSNNNKKIVLAILLALTAPWLAVAGFKGFQIAYAFIKSLPAWQQTATWVSIVSLISIIVGYLLFITLRRLAIRRIHNANDKPRQLGVRLFGGGFADIMDNINTNRQLKFKAVGFTFIPRSIKGDTVLSICDEPFPCAGFPVREAVRTWSGAVAQRRAEEPSASSTYSKWASQHHEIVAMLDIVGKGQGYTGLSCLHTWRWLGKPDVFRFLIVVFDPEEVKTEENADNNISNAEIEKEVEKCIS